MSKQPRSKKLKLWNGRWLHDNMKSACVYVAAYSQKDVLALVEETIGYVPRGMTHEIRHYWSAGLWGNHMEGVTPERGIWLQEGYEKPRRLHPHVNPAREDAE